MAKLTKCKTCKEEIAKSAKVCPKCGAKQGSALWKAMKLVIGLFAVVIILIAIGANEESGRGKAVVEGSTSNQSADAGPQIISTSKSVTIDKYKLSIKNIDKSSKFRDLTGILTATAQPGAVLVAVIVEYENVDTKPLNPFSLPELHLMSPDKVVYDQDMGKSMAYAGIMEIDSKAMSDINPGLSSQDVFVFEVSEKLYKKKGWMLTVGSRKDIMFKI